MSVETLEVNTTNYTLEVTNGTTQTLEVTEGITLDLLLSEMGLQGPAGPTGKGITSVVKTSTVGLVDTYTITFNDSTTQTFTVTNGANGTNGTNGSNGRGIISISRTSGTGAPGTTDTYTITYTDATTSTFTVYNGANGTGSVSSVGLSVPTGLTVSNSPITTSGTIAVTYTAGYSIPTTTKQSNWDTAYGWGNHASAGYLTSSEIGVSVQAYDADLTSWAAISPSAKQDTLVSGSNIKTINSTSLLGSGNVVTGDVTLAGAQTLTNKTITLTSNSITGTKAQFNTALTDGDFLFSGEAVPITGGVASGLTLNDGYTEEVFAVTGTTPALSPANGSIQTWTLTGNSTPTAGTWTAGQSITLMIDDGSAYTITWTSLAVTWKTNGGTAPTLNTSGYTAIALWKIGTTIYGARVGDA